MGRGARLAFAAACLAAVLASPGLAAPETSAPALRPDVLAAWHDPPVVQPHTQWHGYLQLARGSNVTAAAFQVCRVGLACFAPPMPAQDLGNATWGFDTTDYTVAGRPVDYEASWRLGVKWWLTEDRDGAAGNATAVVEFPAGPDTSSPACDGDAAMACAEAHYLAFDVARAPKGSPAATALPALLALVARAVFARRART